MTVSPARRLAIDTGKTLAAIAQAEHNMSALNRSAIRVRTNLPKDRHDAALREISRAELAVTDWEGFEQRYRLTPKGWNHCGQTPPIWRAEV